jgi:hypothetical protein
MEVFEKMEEFEKQYLQLSSILDQQQADANSP